MISEALSWYVESLSAFWVAMAGGGLLKLILICCFIYWICCRGRRWRWHHHGCGCHSGCPCCGGEADEATEATEAAEVGTHEEDGGETAEAG